MRASPLHESMLRRGCWYCPFFLPWTTHRQHPLRRNPGSSDLRHALALHPGPEGSIFFLPSRNSPPPGPRSRRDPSSPASSSIETAPNGCSFPRHGEVGKAGSPARHTVTHTPPGLLHAPKAGVPTKAQAGADNENSKASTCTRSRRRLGEAISVLCTPFPGWQGLP